MSTTFRPMELAGAMTLSGREQLLQMPFKAGVAHVDGKYGFTQSNYLIEGANRIMNPGSGMTGPDAIFIYLHWKFVQQYPQKANGPFWPPVTPASLTELAQTAPYQALFNMPFNLFVMTTFGFKNQDRIDSFRTDPDAASNEEQEFYDLTRYLCSTYAGTGKTFILKNWEGDYRALPDGILDQGDAAIAATDISPQRLDAMILWMEARQRGVSRARNDSGNPAGVGVFHAVEMSRVLDYTRLGRSRLVNLVIPVVQSDMVSYSSYDSSSIKNGPDAPTTRAAMNEALNAIKSFAPDPLNLGDKRILISEYGLFENLRTPTDVQWRTQTILETSQAASILGAFMWQVFDNECYKDYPTNKQPFPVDCSPGDPERPLNTQCKGLWVVKPNEDPGAALPLVAPWFRPSTSGVTLTGRVTSTSGGGVANAFIAFFGGQAAADANGNYSLTNVPSDPEATVQFTASAPGYQGSSQSIVVSATQNPTINFALRPSTDAGSLSGKVTSAIDGTALSGVNVSYDGQSTLSDASGNFHFDTVPGGTYNFSAQRTGWVTETVAVNIEPGITSLLNLRLATGGQFNGQVNNNTGAGLAGASVNAHGGLVPTNVTVVTNSSGAFSFGWLPVGDYYLVVTANGYVQDDPQNATATLTVGATTSKTITMTPKSDFSLTVTPSSKTITGGNPATFTVQLNPLSGFNSPVTLSVTGLPANATASFNPATISSGTSTLTVTTALTTPAGNYALTISGAATGLQHSTQATLTVNAATGTATGKVTNAASGTPISGATVSMNASRSTTTDANGNYTLSNLPAGSMQLSATASGFLTTIQTVNITPGGTTTANFVLITQTGTVSGRITNASTGAGLSGVKVSYSGGSTNSNANGDYTLNAVPPGKYTVTATLTGWVTESASVEVFSGATATANIKLATGGKASGKVTNKSGAAISGATVKVNGGIVPTSVTLTTGSSGTYDSGWVPIGNYSIEVSKTGFTTQTKNATVTTGGTVTVNFTLQ